MTTLRPFVAEDLFRVNNINGTDMRFYAVILNGSIPLVLQSQLSETHGAYNLGFYLQYLCKWPEYFTVAEAPDGTLMGYIMGKAEGKQKDWHGHVTAVTVAPEYRRLGLADYFMLSLEEVSEKIHNAYFVDLFVRVSNKVAITMYTKFGYTVYRKVLGYYSGTKSEDAFDMRKALPRDVDKSSVIPLTRPVYPHEVYF